MRQGRTDAWIAHQLEVTVQQIQTFKREQGLEPDAGPDAGVASADFDDEIDLRAADDALIAAELEAEAQAAAARAEAEAAARAAAEAAARAQADDAEAPADDDGDEKPKRRRSRRGGSRARGKARAGGPWEATFDHGDEGIGLWLDPAVQDDPIYAESWAGHRPVEVSIAEDVITIRRAGSAEPETPETTGD